MGTIKERFYEVMDELGLNDYKVYTNVDGITKNMMTKLRNGETSEVSIKIIAPFCSHYNINADYIVTGRKNPLLENLITNDSIQEIYHPKYSERKIEDQEVTLYDISAAANLKTLLDNKYQNILGKISIPDMPRCDGAVLVTGDSMYPLLKSGDIIAYKEMQDFNNIIFGEMYLVSFEIEGDEFLTVKYVNRSETENYIKLVSYNTHHDPKDIPIESINAMALVKLSIRKNTMR